jgi:hypothetical protein
MKTFITKYNKDYYGGALMLLIGLGAIFQGSSYPIGTLSRMGPGFFPVSLGVILAFIGVAIAASAKSSVPEGDVADLPPEWRGWICIIVSIIAFVVLGKYGGLVPATFAVVFISALGDRQNTVMSAFVLAIAMVAVCVTVFWWALQLPFSLFQWG